MRTSVLTADGSFLIVNTGTVVPVPNGALNQVMTRSDVTRTPEHAAWLKDKRVWLPPTPYYAHFVKYVVAPNGYHKYPPSGLERVGRISDLCSYPGFRDANTSVIEDKAIFAIREAVKNNKIQWGAAIGEMQQTISLVAQSAKSLATAYYAAKDGNWRVATRELGIDWSRGIQRRLKKPQRRYRGRATAQERKFANKWLELQFGWKPLLSDIQGAAESLADQATATPSAIRFRATGGASIKMSNDPNSYNTNSYESVFSYQVNHGVSGIRYVFWYSVVNRNAVEAARTGLLDIGATAWELVPWSFVADWVYPIGRTLESLTALAGKEFISGTKTTYHRQDSKSGLEVAWTSVGTILSGIYKTLKWRWMSRSVVGSWDYLPMPNLKNPLSVTHALDALALLAQSSRSFYH